MVISEKVMLTLGIMASMYGSLNPPQNEHGLIVPEYNSWLDYNFCITAWPSAGERLGDVGEFPSRLPMEDTGF